MLTFTTNTIIGGIHKHLIVRTCITLHVICYIYSLKFKAALKTIVVTTYYCDMYMYNSCLLRHLTYIYFYRIRLRINYNLFCFFIKWLYECFKCIPEVSYTMVMAQIMHTSSISISKAGPMVGQRLVQVNIVPYTVRW